MTPLYLYLVAVLGLGILIGRMTVKPHEPQSWQPKRRRP